MGVPQNGWFIREILLKMDDLGVPPILGNPQIDIDVPLNDPWASQRSCAARRRQADCTTTAAWSMSQ